MLWAYGDRDPVHGDFKGHGPLNRGVRTLHLMEPMFKKPIHTRDLRQWDVTVRNVSTETEEALVKYCVTRPSLDICNLAIFIQSIVHEDDHGIQWIWVAGMVSNFNQHARLLSLTPYTEFVLVSNVIEFCRAFGSKILPTEVVNKKAIYFPVFCWKLLHISCSISYSRSQEIKNVYVI